MKAISIRQPWAWLVAAGHKTVENRSKPHSYRGPLLIHAGQKFDRLQWWAVKEWLEEVFPRIRLPEPGELALGALIGRAVLVDVRRDSKSPWAQEKKWHWILAQARELEEPIGYKGKLGLFDVSKEVLAR